LFAYSAAPGRKLKIGTQVDISLALKVTAQAIRKIPYATNNALTAVAKEMVAAGKVEIQSDFTVRKSGRQSIVNRVQILQYSKVADLTTIVGINPDVQGSPILLGFFEEGGTKEPDNGPGIAIPITGSPARETFGDAVTRALLYTKLQLQLAATGNRIEGLQQTYEVPGVGIFQRVAPGNGPEATVLIYKFQTSAPLKKHMDLIARMSDVVNSRFNEIFWIEYEKEVTRQKPKS
jgi:hypothetical protein